MAEEPPPPGSGGRDREAEVAAAIADLEQLADVPIDEHHDRLARSHEVLHRALTDPPDAAPGSHAPGVDAENGETRH